MQKKRLKKEDLTLAFFHDMWLEKYHGTNSKEVLEKYPELAKTPDWFYKYPCTQEQSDEWEKEAKAILKEVYKLSNQRLNREWGWIYISAAPYVKRDKDENK